MIHWASASGYSSRTAGKPSAASLTSRVPSAAPLLMTTCPICTSIRTVAATVCSTMQHWDEMWRVHTK